MQTASILLKKRILSSLPTPSTFSRGPLSSPLLKTSHGLLSQFCPFSQNRTTICVVPLSARSRIWPFFTVMRSFKSLVNSVVTQSNLDKGETMGEPLNRVLCTIGNTASSNRDICNAVQQLCHLGNVSDIANLLQFLQSNSITLGCDAYNILLAAASESSDIELSIAIFNKILVSSKCLSLQTYCNLAKAFANSDNCDILLEFVREISDITYHSNILILNRLIYAFAECWQIEKAIVVFDYMKTLKCKPDLVTYNTVIGILGRAGLLDEMLQEFLSLKEAKIVPDIVTYNTLLNRLQKLGRLDLCLAYMREVEEKGLIPDLRTYTALIESFGRAGHMDEALRLFDAMKHRQVRPSIYIYRSLINNLKKMGKLEAAAFLVDEMNYSLPYLVGPRGFKRKKR